MKKFISTTFLLVFFAAMVFASTSMSFYDKGNYVKAIETVNSKANPSQDDYLAKTLSLYKMNRIDEARESCLIYMLLSDENDDRSDAADIFVEMDFSDVLNVLVLKPTDSLRAQIALYQSYSNLKQYENARSILDYYLITSLNNYKTICTLLVNFPVEDSYVLSFFKSWYNSISDAELKDFVDLLFEFSKFTEISETSLKEVLKICEGLIYNSTVLSDSSLLQVVYKTMGLTLEKLHDNYNSNIYYSQAYKLNPYDPDLVGKVNGRKK